METQTNETTETAGETAASARKGHQLGMFIAGIGVGAAIGLLLAPRAGAEVREVVRDLAETAGGKLRELAEEAQVKLMEALEEGKEKLLEKKTILASAIEAGREAMAAAERENEGPQR